MKRSTILLLALVLSIAGFSGCGGDELPGK